VPSDLGDEYEDDYIKAPHQEEDDWDDEEREMDLAPTFTAENHEAPRQRLTAAQRRVQAQWGDLHRRPEDKQAQERVEAELVEAGCLLIVDTDHDWNRDERDADDATSQWLAKNDAQYERNRVEAEIRKAALEHGLTMEQVRSAFKRGYVTPERTALRQKVREALFWPWESADNRSLVAEVIGCHRDTLYALMD